MKLNLIRLHGMAVHDDDADPLYARVYCLNLISCSHLRYFSIFFILHIFVRILKHFLIAAIFFYHELIVLTNWHFFYELLAPAI